MYKRKKISLVIPARNEQRLIRPTLEHLPRLIDKIYVIDDGSTDKTAEVVKNCAKKDKRITLIQHKVNNGPGQAVITGYKRVIKDNYDIAVVVGGDYQMSLEEVKRFLNPLIKEEADYTKGNRFMMEGNAFGAMPKIRLLGNSMISLLTKIASGYYKIFDVVDGYTAINKKALRTINWDKAWKKYGYPMDFLIRLNTYGLRVKDVPRTAIYREGEVQSQIKPVRYAIRVSPMLLRGFFWRLKKSIIRDFHPLVFFYLASFVLLPIGFIYGCYLIYKRFTFGSIALPGVILDLFLLVSGLQFLFFAMWFDMEHSRDLNPS